MKRLQCLFGFHTWHSYKRKPVGYGPDVGVMFIVNEQCEHCNLTRQRAEYEGDMS